MYAEPLARVVVDAGPLIGLLNRGDAFHAEALRGFDRLAAAGTSLVVPLPVIFEVFKWLLHRTDLVTARTALTWMLEDVQIVYFGPVDLEETLHIMDGRSDWAGSLEDAAVAMVAIRLDAPVWTIDYRDLSAFRSLQFWTPA